MSLEDISGVLIHHETHAPLAYSATYQRRELHVLDETDIRPDSWSFSIPWLECEWSYRGAAAGTIASGLWDDLRRRPSKLRISSIDRHAGWICSYGCRSSLSLARPLARMQATTLRSRDGLNLVSYLTLPAHRR